MSVWTAKELAGKAKRPKVWEKLKRQGVCEKHRPSIQRIDAAIELLEANGAPEAADRLKAFRGYRREELHEIVNDY